MNNYNLLAEFVFHMVLAKIKGHELEVLPIKDSFYRRAVQISNKIIDVLKKLDLSEDDLEIPIERMAMKKASASVSWYFEGFHLHYGYSSRDTFCDNLNVVYRVIEKEVSLLLEKKRTVDEFISEFSEDLDIKEQRKEARELLGVGAGELDISVIDKRFKELAKELHPDKDSGDIEKFKAVNRAHKMLRRELS